MKPTTLVLSTLSLLPSVLAQNVTVPSTCIDGFSAGTDTVIYTVPYTYAQTLSIIGSFKNLTWSGNPDDTVTLNGTDNTVGTARSYDLAGAHLVETLLTYSSPPGGPYYENHNLALITVAPFGNVTVYAQVDSTSVISVCNGKASQFNFTAVFCANNVTLGTTAFHTVHTMDAQGVAKLLGGQNFTSCEALGGTNGSSTSTMTGSVPKYTGAAAVASVDVRLAGAIAAGALALALM